MRSLISGLRLAAAVALFMLTICHGFQLHNNNHHHHITTSSSTKVQRSPPTTALNAAVSSDSVSDKKFDLAIIGAGPVGVSAALLAARSPHNKNVILIDAPRASGALMNEATGEDLSIGGPTGLFSKALRDTGKRISVTSLKGMGLRDDR